jgi:hypothetical protein
MKWVNWKIAIAPLVVVVSLIGAVGPVGATPSDTATLVLMRNPDLEEIGWYADFPGFHDVGSWTSDFRAFGGGKSPVFAGLIKTTQSGGHGSFHTSFQVLEIGDSFGGSCQISGGTGDYAGIHGSGSWRFDAEGDVRFYRCTAAVHWD